MRKWPLLVVLVCACSRAPSPGSAMTGAPTARDAAMAFLNAVKAEDLQAMGSVWGTDKGPARDGLERTELDRRLVLLQLCYNHDRFQILDDRDGGNGARVIRIQVTRGNVTKVPAFTVVRGPSNRWYVEDTDYPAVQGEFCRAS